MNEIETDYLIIGAGAAGMAFTDALIEAGDADVVMVDRRHTAGGHWNDAYPFVRLHQALANYGVNSRVLGTDSIDATGPNAGFYERATGAEICGYFQQVLEEDLLRSGRVRFVGMCDYVGDWSTEHAIRSRLTGRTAAVRVRRRVVDTTYLQVSVPATHRPAFTVDPEARLVPVGDLVALGEPPSGYTILGAGKTAMDACNWLLDNGVDPDRIRWVKPRDAWVLDRAALQPLDLLASTIEGWSIAVEALALAETVADLFARLEACGHLARLDATVEPTMFRGAILSETERDRLQQIQRVARHGRVKHVGADRIVLEDGEIPTTRGELHVDCTASGFRTAPAQPIFEAGRITLQSLQGGFTTFNAALVAFIEATRDEDIEKNRLCPPNPQPSTALDWITMTSGLLRVGAIHPAEPDLAAWTDRARLSLTRGMGERMGDPRLEAAMNRWATSLEPAMTNAEVLLAESASLVRS